MKLLYSLSIILFLFASCSSNEKQEVIRRVSHKTSFEAPKVDVNRVLEIEIEGMMCVMGCGASIRKELRSTNAVGNVEFDFEKDRKTNIAKIYFDKNKVSADKLITIISTMNDKQFIVGKSTTKEIECSDSDKECKEHCKKECKTEEKSSIEISSNSTIEVPNLLNLLTQFILN